MGLDRKMLPILVRHNACQITSYQVKSDGKTPYERLRGRQYGVQVEEFTYTSETLGRLRTCRGWTTEPELVVGKELGIG